MLIRMGPWICHKTNVSLYCQILTSCLLSLCQSIPRTLLYLFSFLAFKKTKHFFSAFLKHTDRCFGLQRDWVFYKAKHALNSCFSSFWAATLCRASKWVGRMEFAGICTWVTQLQSLGFAPLCSSASPTLEVRTLRLMKVRWPAQGHIYKGLNRDLYTFKSLYFCCIPL